jgi:DnaJ-class molecular chaperone
MPIHQDNAEPEALIRDVARMDKGDLYLRFEIEFPKELTSEQKSQLLEVL